jgi:hypothetical protein
LTEIELQYRLVLQPCTLECLFRGERDFVRFYWKVNLFSLQTYLLLQFQSYSNERYTIRFVIKRSSDCGGGNFENLQFFGKIIITREPRKWLNKWLDNCQISSLQIEWYVSWCCSTIFVGGYRFSKVPPFWPFSMNFTFYFFSKNSHEQNRRHFRF